MSTRNQIDSLENRHGQVRQSHHANRDQLAVLVRLAYIDERTFWHCSRGGPVDGYQPGKQWDETWNRMADFLLKHDIRNYRAFIHLQFTKHGILSCCPSPKQCYGPDALRRWQQQHTQANRKKTLFQIKLAFGHQLRTFNSSVAAYLDGIQDATQEEAEADALLDEYNGITALFRYCAAVAVGYDDVASEYREGALWQYSLSAELYDLLWKDLIPEALRREARQLRFPR